jgi:hypothetical protein
MLEIFKHITDYDMENQLNLSGTILAILISTSTFVLQSGFTLSSIAEVCLLNTKVHQSKIHLLSLAYNIIFLPIIPS